MIYTLHIKERAYGETFPGGLFDDLTDLELTADTDAEQNGKVILDFTSRYLIIYRGAELELDSYTPELQQYYTDDLPVLAQDDRTFLFEPPNFESKSFPDGEYHTEWLTVEILDSQEKTIRQVSYDTGINNGRWWFLEYDCKRDINLLLGSKSILEDLEIQLSITR